MFDDYSYIIIPIIVLIASQTIKLLTDGIKGNFNPKGFLVTYGGMPSSHTAFTASITTLIGLRLGWGSPLFAVALVFTILIVRDAAGLRRQLGQQGKFLNALAKNKGANFNERMGHTPLEIMGGAIWGIGLTILLNMI